MVWGVKLRKKSLVVACSGDESGTGAAIIWAMGDIKA